MLDTKKNTVFEKKARYIIIWYTPGKLRLVGNGSFPSEALAEKKAEKEMLVVEQLWGKNSGHSFKVVLDTPNNRKGVYEYKSVKTHIR